jgi:hypothetical protein
MRLRSAGGDPAWPITHGPAGSLPEFHKAWSAAQPRSAEFAMPMDLAGAGDPRACGFSSDGLPTAFSSPDDASKPLMPDRMPTNWRLVAPRHRP